MRLQLFPLNAHASRMVILCNPPLGETGTVKIHRLYLDVTGERSLESGIVIHSPETGSCLCILDVQCHDVVSFTPGHDTPPINYRINAHNSAIRVNPWKISDSDEALWAEVVEMGKYYVHNSDTCDDPLSELIRTSSLPSWLQASIHIRIDDWKSHDLEKLIRFAPEHVSDAKLELCSIRYPELSLKNLKSRLSCAQIARCLVVSPMGAALYAFEEMMDGPIGVLCNVVETHPDILLRLHAPELPENILRACAYHAPDVAFELRSNMTREIHAVYLSYSIESIGAFFADETPLEDLQHETINSLADFHDIWLTTFGGDDERLRLTIQTILGVDLHAEDGPGNPFGSINPFDDKALQQNLWVNFGSGRSPSV